MSIGPYEILEKGTPVVIYGKRGEVLNHSVTESGVIVHTIRLTEKYSRVHGATWAWKPFGPKIWRGNYSFVERRAKI